MWRRRPVPGRVPEDSEVRPGLFARFAPVAGQDGQLPPIKTTSVSKTLPTRWGEGPAFVASEELGRVPGLVTAAGPLIDYIMTGAVSITSGVRPAALWVRISSRRPRASPSARLLSGPWKRSSPLPPSSINSEGGRPARLGASGWTTRSACSSTRGGPGGHRRRPSPARCVPYLPRWTPS